MVAVNVSHGATAERTVPDRLKVIVDPVTSWIVNVPARLPPPPLQSPGTLAGPSWKKNGRGFTVARLMRPGLAI
jgi:hypothetical protein